MLPLISLFLVSLSFASFPLPFIAAPRLFLITLDRLRSVSRRYHFTSSRILQCCQSTCFNILLAGRIHPFVVKLAFSFNPNFFQTPPRSRKFSREIDKIFGIPTLFQVDYSNDRLFEFRTSIYVRISVYICLIVDLFSKKIKITPIKLFFARNTNTNSSLFFLSSKNTFPIKHVRTYTYNKCNKFLFP